MSQILNKVRDVDPNDSDAVKDALSTFFHNLPKYTEVDGNRWLRALENVINRFPKYCMSHRSNIETYLAHFLNCSNYYNVVEAAKCAHVLQQVRPTQEKAATPKTCWRDQMTAYCNAAHKLIGVVFPNAVDIYKDSGKVQMDKEVTAPLHSALAKIAKVTSNDLNNAAMDKKAILWNRLRNVFVFIQAMLVEIYPVAKPIRPMTILDVIVRALSVSSGAMASEDTPNVGKVKTQALRSLDAMAICLGPNLVPFSPLVFRIAMQTLKWSSEHPSEEASKVRVSAYHSVTSWLSSLHAHRPASERARSWEDELTAHVIDDVTPHKKIVQLTASAQPMKHLSKKARRKMANILLQESTISSHMPGEKNKISNVEETNDDVVIAALECAETFLIVCGIFLKPTTHKRLQERLVRDCYNLGSCSRERSIALLRALEAARKSTPPTVPPPTQYCLHLYSTHVNSEHREISSFCSQALLDIRLHLHCSPPSLNYAIEEKQDDNKEDRKKQMLERNKAALESLLNDDKSPIIHEEVITIYDEPVTKKARVEEVADKISVSSDSQISLDDSDIEGVDKDIEGVDKDVEAMELVEDRNGEFEKKVTDIDENIDEIDGGEVADDEDTAEVDDDEDNEVTEVVTKGDDIDEKRSDKFKNINEDEICEVDSTQSNSIFEMATQMPLHVNDTLDEEEPLSLEVGYDYPNTGSEKISVIDKIDDENLPSTNETDDIQITCGQTIKSSQDDLKKSDDVLDAPKTNGEISLNVIVENGIVSEGDGEKNSSSIAKSNDAIDSSDSKTNDVTVEDMIADFVDEVNDETQVSTQVV